MQACRGERRRLCVDWAEGRQAGRQATRPNPTREPRPSTHPPTRCTHRIASHRIAAARTPKKNYSHQHSLTHRIALASLARVTHSPSAKVGSQSEACIMPSQRAPRAAWGSSGECTHADARSPPSHMECLPPRSGLLVLWSRGPPLSHAKVTTELLYLFVDLLIIIRT